VSGGIVSVRNMGSRPQSYAPQVVCLDYGTAHAE
jgi:hypothetical protein